MPFINPSYTISCITITFMFVMHRLYIYLYFTVNKPQMLEMPLLKFLSYFFCVELLLFYSWRIHIVSKLSWLWQTRWSTKRYWYCYFVIASFRLLLAHSRENLTWHDKWPTWIRVDAAAKSNYPIQFVSCYFANNRMQDGKSLKLVLAPIWSCCW